MSAGKTWFLRVEPYAVMRFKSKNLGASGSERIVSLIPLLKRSAFHVHGTR